MQTLWIECEDGVERPFHAKHTDAWYDLSENEQELGDDTDYLELILEEDGEPIPKSICICAAHADDTCICGSWDGDYDEYFTEEYAERKLLEKKLESRGYNLDDLERDNPYNQWIYE